MTDPTPSTDQPAATEPAQTRERRPAGWSGRPRPSGGRRTQRDRSDTTSAEVVEAARELFARDGYAATSLDAVCELAGVSKGAVYHHFRGKHDLFAAVYAREETAVAGLVAAAFRAEPDPWAGMVAGCRRYLEASLDPGVQRIMLLDGPGVLGGDRALGSICREQMRLGMTYVARAGLFPADQAEAMSSLLHGAGSEAALAVAHADDPGAALAAAVGAIELLFAGLARISAAGATAVRRPGAAG